MKMYFKVSRKEFFNKVFNDTSSVDIDTAFVVGRYVSMYFDGDCLLGYVDRSSPRREYYVDVSLLENC